MLDGADQYVDAAEELYHQYCYSLWQLMSQYEVWDESEILSGFVGKFAARYSRQRGPFDIQGRLNQAVKSIRQHFLRIFWEEFSANGQVIGVGNCVAGTDDIIHKEVRNFGSTDNPKG